MVTQIDHFTRVASVESVRKVGCETVHVEGHTIALFAYGDDIYAVDNRCPHMGFPLNKGSVNDGILTCYWHYARFDVKTGGTFDQFADDVRAFPVEIRDGDVYLDLNYKGDRKAYLRQRLRIGLERDISLVIAKSIIGLLDGGTEVADPFRMGLEFGTQYRSQGWGQGLTINGCMINLIPHLNKEDRAQALFHGLSAVASDTSGHSPRFLVGPLPGDMDDMPTLKKWLRNFIKVRDDEGSERCILTALRAGATHQQMADMIFAAATDHRYIEGGHVLDFINKAFESLDVAGWEHADWALTSLAPLLAGATRMEESNAWRNPVDLIEILDETFSALPEAVQEGHSKQAMVAYDEVVPVLLGDDPHAIAKTLLDLVRDGVIMTELAAVVTYAAAVRIARFHTSNEFGDWDTALHTFTFANAVHQGLRRVESIDLLRGVFDAAMSVYLDRFLNIPAAKIPEPNGSQPNLETLLSEYPDLLNLQQQVNQAGKLVGDFLYHDGDAAKLIALMGKLLLREDRNFHTIQMVEAAVQQYQLRSNTSQGVHVLIAAARYLAAHAPTMRAQGQTYTIAHRLARGEDLFEGE